MLNYPIQIETIVCNIRSTNVYLMKMYISITPTIVIASSLYMALLKQKLNPLLDRLSWMNRH